MYNRIRETAAACGGLIQYKHRVSQHDRFGRPDRYWEERFKSEMKYAFGNYVVRKKIYMEERELHHDILEQTAELLVFTPEQLCDFLHRLGVRIHEELDYEEHMGIPYC